MTATGLVFLLAQMSTPTTAYTDARGRVHQVLAYEPFHEVGVNRQSGRGYKDQYLLFRYYSDAITPQLMPAEAQSLAPEFFAAADSLGQSVLIVQASRPWLWKPLPVRIEHIDVRYERNADGQWVEREHQ